MYAMNLRYILDLPITGQRWNIANLIYISYKLISLPDKEMQETKSCKQVAHHSLSVLELGAGQQAQPSGNWGSIQHGWCKWP